MDPSLLDTTDAGKRSSTSRAGLLQSPAAPAPEPVASSVPLPRPAWIEIDLRRLNRNFQIIARDKPAGVRILSVVKDGGYGHGAIQVARAALECGASYLAISTLEEAMAL